MMNFKYLLFSTSILIITANYASAGFSSKKIWTREEIKTCFAEKDTDLKLMGESQRFSEWKQDEKDFIKESVQQEYRPEITGFHFIGWEDCAVTTRPNIILYKRPKLSLRSLTHRAQATNGQGFFPVSRKYPSAVGVAIFYASGIDRKSTIVHEFGHIIGLHHEHDHPDAKELAVNRCSHYSDKNEFNTRVRLYTDFDEVSVMNYCHIHNSNDDVGLSAGDIAHIRMLYNNSIIKDKRTF